MLRVLVFVLVAMSGARAHAQPCAQPVTNLATTSGVCAVRITWTPSANTVTQVVRWGVAPTFNLSVVIGTVGPNVGSFDHTTPVGATNYYWVVSNPVNFVSCTAVVAGPTTGTTLEFAPAPVTVIPGCSSTSIIGQSVFDATSYRYYRRLGDSTDDFVLIDESPLPIFTDAIGVPGVVYDYAVVPKRAGCTSFGVGTFATFGGVGGVRSMPPTLVVTDGEAGSTLLQPSLVLPPGAALQWMKNGQPLVEDGRAYNVTGGNLQINPPHLASDAGVYKLRMTTSCGVRYSPEVCIVVLPRACPADFNASGTKDVQDIFDFLNAWFAPCP